MPTSGASPEALPILLQEAKPVGSAPPLLLSGRRSAASQDVGLHLILQMRGGGLEGDRATPPPVGLRKAQDQAAEKREKLLAAFMRVDATGSGKLPSEAMLRLLASLHVAGQIPLVRQHGEGLLQRVVNAFAAGDGSGVEYAKFLEWLYSADGSQPTQGAISDLQNLHDKVHSLLTKAAENFRGETQQRRSSPSWTVAGWLGDTVSHAVRDALVEACGPFQDRPELDLCLAQALGQFLVSRGETPTVDLVRRSFEQTDLLGKLAKLFQEKLKELSECKEVSGEVLNTKFAAEGGNFELAYGPLHAFTGGLDSLVGMPDPRVFEEMEKEHCRSVDSNETWTTDNYGISTTPKIEWFFVVSPEKGKLEMDIPAYPKETKNMHFLRSPQELSEFDEVRDDINSKLKAKNEKTIGKEEFVAARLYTGPMFEKYNASIRGGSTQLKQADFMKNIFSKLCKGNRFSTTIQAVNSSLIKLSKLTHVQKVYRGVSGGYLPDAFWTPDKEGACGAVEYGFMSTTTKREVAHQYARGNGSDKDKAELVMEIQMSAVDRGADLSGLSQYPQEREICFGPCAALQVEGWNVEGSLLVVKMRLNINTMAETIDELIAQRHKLICQMATNFHVEVKDAAQKTKDRVQSLAGFQLLPEVVVAKAAEKLSSFKRAEPTSFLDDALFLKGVQDAMGHKQTAELALSFWQEDLMTFGKAPPVAEALASLSVMEDERMGGDSGEPALKLQRLSQFSELARDIEQGDPGTRLAALERLLKVVAPGDQQAITMLLGRFNDAVRDVRSATVQAAADIAGESNIPEIVALFDKEDRFFRQGAARLLGKVAAKGNHEVIALLRQRLSDHEPYVKEAAAEALGRVACSGDQETISMLYPLLQDGDRFVREAAAIAVGKLAPSGDELALSKLQQALAQELEDKVKQTLIDAMAALADQADQLFSRGARQKHGERWKQL